MAVVKDVKDVKGEGIRRVHSENCIIGDYAIFMDRQLQETRPDYVVAEIVAHNLARANPSRHVMVAQVSAQFVGVPHVYEVRGKHDKGEE